MGCLKVSLLGNLVSIVVGFVLQFSGYRLLDYYYSSVGGAVVKFLSLGYYRLLDFFYYVWLW